MPIKKKWVRGDQLPWITPDIQREISRRNRMFKEHVKNPTKTSWEEFKKQRNKVMSLKRKGMKLFCMETSMNSRHHGEFWNKMRPLLPRRGKNQLKIALIDNERVITISLRRLRVKLIVRSWRNLLIIRVSRLLPIELEIKGSNLLL